MRDITLCIQILKLNRDATAPRSQDRLKHLLPNGCTGGLVVRKALSLNFNFSFLK